MSAPVIRRSARAVLLDGPDLLLIKRTRPGRQPYWTTIGGGVEPEDSSLEDTLCREVLDEIGARVRHVAQILMLVDRSDEGIAVQHIFLAELDAAQRLQRTGKEFNDSNRGEYEVVRVPFTVDGLAGIDLKPTTLADYLRDTHDALLASTHIRVMNSTAVRAHAGE